MLTDYPGCISVSIGREKESHRGAHGEQQHGEHRSGQEAGGAAEDGGQHRQDKGDTHTSAMNVILLKKGKLHPQ